MNEKDLSRALSNLRIKGLSFDYDYFTGNEFNIDNIIEKAVQLEQNNNNKGRSFTDQPVDHSTLLASLSRLDEQLGELSKYVSGQCTTLQDAIKSNQASHTSKIAAAERELANLNVILRDIESRGDALGSFASRLGSRLQSIEMHKKRGTNAASALQYLAAFSTSQDLSSLPEIFHNDDTMEAAAMLVGQLTEAVRRTLQSNNTAQSKHHRGGTANDTFSHNSPIASTTTSTIAPVPMGTLEAAAEQLELYRNVLDNRVVAMFDSAMKAQDFSVMSRCARIMAMSGAQGEFLLVSRYVSNNALFSEDEVQKRSASMSRVEERGSSTGGGRDTVGTTNSDHHRHHHNNSSTLQQNQHQGIENKERIDSAATLSAMRSLTELYSRLAQSIRDEAVIMEQVFPDPGKAVCILIQRIFDEIVHSALEHVLSASPYNSTGGHGIPSLIASASTDAATLHALDLFRSYLQLMVEVYRKTYVLAEEAVDIANNLTQTTKTLKSGTLSTTKQSSLIHRSGGESSSNNYNNKSSSGSSNSAGHQNQPSYSSHVSISPRELADAAFGSAFDQYPSLEMIWLGTLGGFKLKRAKRNLHKDLILDFFAMNEEAVKRCAHIMAGGNGGARIIRTLFYTSVDVNSGTTSASNKHTASSSLLSHVGAHVLLGIGGAADRCVRRLSGGAYRLSDPGVQDKNAAAEGEAAASIGTVLQAIAETADIFGMLKSHYDRVIAPHVDANPTESALCVEGLTLLMTSIDNRIAVSLEKVLSALFKKIIFTLSSEQTRGDFRPNAASGTSLIGQPTQACMSAVALLKAVGQQASAHLHGTNLTSFLTAFALRTVSIVESHALKYTFSPEGALRWRTDVSEFASCLANDIGTRAAAQAFEDLYSLAGLLIVPPDTLPGLLDSVDHLDKNRVKAMAERREDYKSRGLQSLFSTH